MPYANKPLARKEAIIDEDIRGWANDSRDKLKNYAITRTAGQMRCAPALDPGKNALQIFGKS